MNMETIKLTHELIDVFYKNMDSDCVQELHNELDKQNLYLRVDERGSDVVTRTNRHLSIPTNYFDGSFVFSKIAYSVGDERLVYAQMQDSYIDVYAKIECEPLGSDGYDTAMFWDMKKDEPLKDHEEFILYPLTIINDATDEVTIYDIWVNNTSYAYIHINDDEDEKDDNDILKELLLKHYFNRE